MNMQDVRKELEVKTIRSKIEKSHFVRIGHVARMSDERLVNRRRWVGSEDWRRGENQGKERSRRLRIGIGY